MDKFVVTLRTAPSEAVEVPDELKRSCFGALRFFPGIPKTVTKDELEFIKSNNADLHKRLHVRSYVESKRVDKRGASEAQIEKLADEAGIGHLKLGRKVEVLEKRGLLKKVAPPKKVEPPKATRKRNGNGK